MVCVDPGLGLGVETGVIGGAPYAQKFREVRLTKRPVVKIAVDSGNVVFIDGGSDAEKVAVDGLKGQFFAAVRVGQPA